MFLDKSCNSYIFPGDYDIRVEQAEFSEISVTASGDGGAVVSVVSYRTGSKVKCDTFWSKSQITVLFNSKGNKIVPT